MIILFNLNCFSYPLSKNDFVNKVISIQLFDIDNYYDLKNGEYIEISTEWKCEKIITSIRLLTI